MPDSQTRRHGLKVQLVLPDGLLWAEWTHQEAVGTEIPIGANKAAARLAERTGLEVERADVETLAQRELLQVVGWYKEWPLYDPGDPSPLREHARLPLTRARAVRSFCAELAARHGVEVWAVYDGAGDRWEVDWTRNADGEPTRGQVEKAIASHPDVARHRRDIHLDTEAGAAIRWARAMLVPGAAVILDTETADLPGPICEIAVIDTDGQVLLDTLVNPGVPITPEARCVHGIGDADVAGAPSWDQVLPRLLDVTAGCQVLAYNADYDRSVVVADAHRCGLSPGHLDDRERWGCPMWARADWNRRGRRQPLGGGHRALGDARAALDVLRRLTTP